MRTLLNILVCVGFAQQASPKVGEGVIVVHATQSRETGRWNERAVLRLCPTVTERKGPKGEAISWMAIAASKPCPTRPEVK